MQFIKGKKYGNGQSYYEVVDRTEQQVVLLHNGVNEYCKIFVEDDIECCFPNGKKKSLKASSMVGKPRRTTEEESRKRRNKKQNAWGKTKYEKLETFVPIGMVKRIEDASREEYGKKNKRRFIIEAVEEKINKTEVGSLINYAVSKK